MDGMKKISVRCKKFGRGEVTRVWYGYSENENGIGMIYCPLVDHNKCRKCIDEAKKKIEEIKKDEGYIKKIVEGEGK